MVMNGRESPIVVVLRYKGQSYKGRGVMVMNGSESPIVVVLRYKGQVIKGRGDNGNECQRESHSGRPQVHRSKL